MKLPPRDSHWRPESASDYQKDVWDAALPHVRDWRVAVDCGAHVGIFTRRMEAKFAEVYAFEPQADNFRCLAQNTTKARLFNCLLWSEPVRMAMKLDDHPNTGAGEIDHTRIGSYPAMALDDLSLSEVGLMKLDVQDAESDVLIGAKETLVRCRPVLIVEDTGRDLRLGDVLARLNYKQVARVRRDGIWVYG